MRLFLSHHSSLFVSSSYIARKYKWSLVNVVDRKEAKNVLNLNVVTGCSPRHFYASTWCLWCENALRHEDMSEKVESDVDGLFVFLCIFDIKDGQHGCGHVTPDEATVNTTHCFCDGERLMAGEVKESIKKCTSCKLVAKLKIQNFKLPGKLLRHRSAAAN
ncbi:hypothetical protein QVD17_36739 [Tagetes erecta]|uniref:Uncharacterized protein n=1 Tax=Tagetes erecta TaxID=13708 RepID=A0AAD8JVC1_TARER|nr:hypothetical protein QVD17_36739 [Tagetes erecta]